MSLYVIVLILLWLFVAVGIAGLLLLIFLYGRHTVRDNPKKALIYIKNGNVVGSPFIGTLNGKPTKKGCKFSYGKDKIVLVPAKYHEVYHKNKRMIFLSRVGQLIASPFANDSKLSENEKEELIYELVSSHIGADSIKALQGHSNLNIIFIAIIAFVFGILAVVGYTYMQKQMTVQPNTSITDTTTKPSSQEIKITPVEVK